MKLNKINIDAYQEILNDLYLFIELNPNSLEHHYDYTPIEAREGYTKNDNPLLYEDMFNYAAKRGVIDLVKEKRKHSNPLPEIFTDDTPHALHPFGGEYETYKIKVSKDNLDKESNRLAAVIEDKDTDLAPAELSLKGDELCIVSEYGSVKVNTLRRGLGPFQFFDYILNAKPDEVVTLTDLKKHDIRLSDSLSEILRKSHINKTIKSFFVPMSTANSVRVIPQARLSRKDWNDIIGSLKKH